MRMRHLLIFINLLSCGVGLILISLVVQRYRTFRQKHLSIYAVHLGCLNLIALADAGLIYVTLNISGEKTAIAAKLIVPWMLLSALLFCALVGYAASYLVMSLELRGKRMQAWHIGLGTGAGIAAMIWLLSGTWRMDFLMRTIHYSNYFARAIVLLAAMLLFWQSAKVGSPGRRVALRGLSAFYILVHLCYFLFFTLRSLWPYTFYSGFYFLCLNLLPLLFLGKFLRYYFGKKLFVPGAAADLEKTLQGYGVSRREQEIIRLVCTGKSNREIEILLFISLKTVKFHLYNIYRKLGVRNRVELVNLVRQTFRDHSLEKT